MKTREYGNEKTSLHLSELAEIAFRQTDPLDIYEIEAWDGTLTYRMKGCIAGTFTADGVNEVLESLLTFRVISDRELWEAEHVTNDGEVDIYDIRRIATRWEMPLENVLEMVEIC